MSATPRAQASFPVKRVVVKLGTNILTAPGGGIDRAQLERIAAEVAGLREDGLTVALVSSGAVGLGMQSLGLSRRPADLATLQACAAIGQGELIRHWQEAFAAKSLRVAQVLLTREDVRSRSRHLAVRQTINKLFECGIIPVVNENDTVSAAEIKFGDNDILSALVASLIQADMLFILSTARGLEDRARGVAIPVVEEITAEIEGLAGGTDSPTAVGGMVTKVEAAKIARRSNCGVIIADGRQPFLRERLAGRVTEGATLFLPSRAPLRAKKRWMLFFNRPEGKLWVDDGAARAIMEGGKSLLASGVTGVEGDFERGATVEVFAEDGSLLARGQAGFSRPDIESIIGKKSVEVKSLFPSRKRIEVIHRNEMATIFSGNPQSKSVS